MDKISERIKQLRRELSFTQQELADALGKSISSIQFWEKGTNEPSKSTLRHIAETLNININWLVNGTGEMKSASNTQNIKGDGNIQNNSGDIMFDTLPGYSGIMRPDTEIPGTKGLTVGQTASLIRTITAALQDDPELMTLIKLLINHATPAMKRDLKDKLLKIKQISEL